MIVQLKQLSQESPWYLTTSRMITRLQSIFVMIIVRTIHSKEFQLNSLFTVKAVLIVLQGMLTVELSSCVLETLDPYILLSKILIGYSLLGQQYCQLIGLCCMILIRQLCPLTSHIIQELFVYLGGCGFCYCIFCDYGLILSFPIFPSSRSTPHTTTFKQFSFPPAHQCVINDQ